MTLSDRHDYGASTGKMTLFGLEQLPEILPVFPLTGALLLPKGHLPLNIFESRYLDMVYYAREKNGLVGMIQPALPARQPQDGNDQLGTARRKRPLYTTGCVGMISDLKENKAGGLMLLLTGLSRYDIIEELPGTQTFRKMRVCYDRFGTDCAHPFISVDIPRQQLVLTVQKYLKRNNIIAEWQFLEKICDEELVNMLAMICPFGAAEKQALLETVALADRIDLMLRMMEFDLCGNGPHHPKKTLQ
ncbi:MAG: peptidase S16 [Alphaproteobacteria bacterium]|nr:peptidase S16 [Alphaproteobacteria bacterium]